MKTKFFLFVSLAIFSVIFVSCMETGGGGRKSSSYVNPDMSGYMPAEDVCDEIVVPQGCECVVSGDDAVISCVDDDPNDTDPPDNCQLITVPSNCVCNSGVISCTVVGNLHGIACTANSCPAGQACNANTGLCYTPATGGCTATTGCNFTTQYCNISTGLCLAKVCSPVCTYPKVCTNGSCQYEPGKNCSSHEECSSSQYCQLHPGLSTSYTCGSKKNNDVTCYSENRVGHAWKSRECSTGVCDSIDSKCGIRYRDNPQIPCTDPSASHSRCSSRDVPQGQYCAHQSSSWDCKVNHCCAKKGHKYRCDYTYQCQSGYTCKGTPDKCRD